MIIYCQQCEEEIQKCRCAGILGCDSYEITVSCGVWGGIVREEPKPNISTPEIEALYPRPVSEAHLSEQEKERIWECLKQAAQG